MRAACAGVAFAALALGGCAKAQNYTEPNAPRHETRHGVPGKPDGTLRVVSFNLKFAEKVDEAIAVLKDIPALREPDILALQEMDAEGTERIARALEMNSIFFPTAIHPRTGRDFGNALLSPWPLEPPGPATAGVAEDLYDASDHKPVWALLALE